MVIKFILQITANALGIALAAYFIPQIHFTGDILDYAVIGAILALANLIIRPILKTITAPLIILTLGLFIIIINAVILFGVDWFTEKLTIDGIWGYLWGTIIISIVNALIIKGYKKRKKHEDE
ncbi:MAG: phage holin family protein [Candidatus Portnoybacteria bacterium]|nr:phage holin family protein [Candidatus Portnoybacteria bacterium]